MATSRFRAKDALSGQPSRPQLFLTAVDYPSRLYIRRLRKKTYNTIFNNGKIRLFSTFNHSPILLRFVTTITAQRIMSAVSRSSSSRSNATLLSYYSSPSIPLLPQPQQRQLFIRCSDLEVPCPEALGYTQGKTLGSGTYAKVKAAWSPFEKRMVRNET